MAYSLYYRLATMRFDPILDAFYIVGSLWGSLSGPQVCPASPEASPRTAFVGVTVIPMDQERVLANQTVLIEDGKITALGPANQVKVPVGAVRVDGRGKYLIPGLTEMHRHWATFDTMDMLDKLAGGVTAARLTGIDNEAARQWRDSVQPKLEVPTPRLYLSPYIPTTMRPDSVAVVVAAAKAAGYDFIKIPGWADDPKNIVPDRALLDSTLAAARRAGLPVAAHHHVWPLDYNLALGAAGGSFEHVLSSAFNDSLGWRLEDWDFVAPAVPLATLQRLAATVQRAGVRVTPTLRCITAKSPDSSSFTKAALQLTKALHDAGVPLLLSADDGWSVHDELREMVRAGLTPYQALRTGTYNVAQYFGKLAEVGTVAVGKRADLVLLGGNPLQDIRYAGEPAGVMVAGRWLDRAELDRRLLTGTTYPTYWVLKSPSSERYRWLVAAVQQRSIERQAPGEKQGSPLRGRHSIQKLAVLVDSLAVVPPLEKRAYESLMGRLATELGALRATLTPESYEVFDPIARVWLREQRRQGYQAAVPGIASAP